MKWTDGNLKCFRLRPLPNHLIIASPLCLPFSSSVCFLCCNSQIHWVILGSAHKLLWPSLSELWSESRLLLPRLFFFLFPVPPPHPPRKVAAESRTVAMATSWQLPELVTVLISEEEAVWEGVELWGGTGRLLCTSLICTTTSAVLGARWIRANKATLHQLTRTLHTSWSVQGCRCWLWKKFCNWAVKDTRGNTAREVAHSSCEGWWLWKLRYNCLATLRFVQRKTAI